MDAHEILGAATHHTFLVLYRIKKAGHSKPEVTRKRLTDELAKLNGEKKGRFFEEAGHVSTSAWTVRLRSDVTAHDLVQKLKRDAKLTAGVDYLWAVQIAEPIAEAHLTKSPMPAPGAKATAASAMVENLTRHLGAAQPRSPRK